MIYIDPLIPNIAFGPQEGINYEEQAGELATPVARTAKDVTSTGFTAQWFSATNADKYYLDVATDSGFHDFVLEDFEVDALEYAVTGLTPSTTYYYRVRAVRVYETSPYSNVMSGPTSA